MKMGGVAASKLLACGRAEVSWKGSQLEGGQKCSRPGTSEFAMAWEGWRWRRSWHQYAARLKVVVELMVKIVTAMLGPVKRNFLLGF
jgi:hypothetical protein